jgi:hypothetical protein
MVFILYVSEKIPKHFIPLSILTSKNKPTYAWTQKQALHSYINTLCDLKILTYGFVPLPKSDTGEEVVDELSSVPLCTAEDEDAGS